MAAAHVSLATYHHKLGQVEALREPSLSHDGSPEGGEEEGNGDEAAAAGGINNASSSSSSTPASGILNLDRRLDKAARHMAAAAYLFELLGGPLHPETVDAYQKLGQVLYRGLHGVFVLHLCWVFVFPTFSFPFLFFLSSVGKLLLCPNEFLQFLISSCLFMF